MTDSSGLVPHLGYVDTLNVAISICLTYTLVVSGIRIYLRRSSFGSDDAVVLIATIIALIHFATCYVSLSAGLGKPYDMLDASLPKLNTTAIIGSITFILGLYAAKIAALVFLMRIESKARNRILYYALIGLWAVFAIASIVTVTASCPAGSGYYWNIAGNSKSCPSEWTRWKIMTVLDIISETILLILPIYLVRPLQMPLSRKIMIVTTFWTRFPTIALTIVRERYVGHLRSSSVDASLESTVVVILMQVELTYALISCTLSTSKNFTDGFNTGWGMGHIRGAAESYNMSHVGGSGGRTTGGSKSALATVTDTVDYPATYSIDRLRGAPHRKSRSYEFHGEQGLHLRPDPGLTSHTVVHSKAGRWVEEGSVSSESDDLGIVRQTEYTVSHDEAPILQKHYV